MDFAKNSTIVTPTIKKIVEMLETDAQRIFVHGFAGSGKSTLINTLEHHWKQRNRAVATIRLREIRTENDLFHRLSESLRRNSHRHLLGSIRQSSSQSIVDSVLDHIVATNERLLILMDGFDEIREPEILVWFLRKASEGDGISIVGTGRRHLTDSRVISVFKTNLMMEAFSMDDLTSLIQNVAPKIKLTQNQVQWLMQAGNGSPLITVMLLAHLSTSDIESFIRDFDKDNQGPTQLIKTIIDRSIHKIDLPKINTKEIYLLLTVLAHVGPLAPSDFPPEKNVIATELVRFGLIVNESGLYQFSHAILREHFLRHQSFLPQDFNLNSLAFGAEEAERDARLKETFHALPGSEDLLNGNKNIVIGDRGSGKSAYFSQLKFLKTQLNSKAASEFLPVQHPANILENLQASGSPLATAEQFRAGWLTLIACALAPQLPETISSQLKKAASQLIELADSGKAEPTPLRGFFTRLLTSSVKIKIGPLTIEPALSEKARKTHWI